MTTPAARPKIFHITHVDNLRSIVAAGKLFSDASMIARGGPLAGIGMSTIKQRRLVLPVTCHANDHVGDYVPFYFCARSIMLYVIHCANHPDLTYRGGQAPIVHMQADLHAVVAWARQHHRRWSFSLSNAGARYANFRADPADLAPCDRSDFATCEHCVHREDDGRRTNVDAKDPFRAEIGAYVSKLLGERPFQQKVTDVLLGLRAGALGK